MIPFSASLRRLALSLALLLGAPATLAAQADPYILSNTEVIAIPASKLGRDYEVYVSLPAAYKPQGKRYAVLYVPDANYGFPVVRAIADRINRHGVGLEDFILVGLSYAKGDNPADSRRRDYTPTKGQRGSQPVPGQAGESAAYLQYLKTEVFPLIEKRYAADPARRLFIGHSYGGLLGLQALFTEPTLFSHYILGSASLWFDNRYFFAAEQQYANAHKRLPAKVRMYIGSYETPGKGPRYNKDTDMVGDQRDFVRQIQSHRYQGLDLQATVLQDEDHATLFPAMLSRGLMWALSKP
ncbi:alpha/beta hydrolase [Chitinimonas sp. BJYL2]|uniref:alpha/beta hydrolase n=1 Tax=Chitinimonas sp. BJYL2 TaxID=2976696 RepID=UPI0022B2C7EB|nr:alpha/beta hydrolase-fold protein [Chitinimonas sp. BJYL2]